MNMISESKSIKLFICRTAFLGLGQLVKVIRLENLPFIAFYNLFNL